MPIHKRTVLWHHHTALETLPQHKTQDKRDNKLFPPTLHSSAMISENPFSGKSPQRLYWLSILDFFLHSNNKQEKLPTQFI